MTDDARFEEGGERPLRLMAWDAEDLKVIAALVQDAVLLASEMSWHPRQRRFDMLLSRFRWEGVDAALGHGRPVERVQSVLSIQDVEKVQSQGVKPGEKDTVLSILDISFEPTDEVGGQLHLVFAGDGDIRLTVEALEVILRDVSQPYEAPSHRVPQHPA